VFDLLSGSGSTDILGPGSGPSGWGMGLEIVRVDGEGVILILGTAVGLRRARGFELYAIPGR